MSAVNIKNYTSTVPVSRTISRIEEVLAAMGAKAIGKNYEDGKVASITFQLTIEGRDFLIRLPANPEAVFDVLIQSSQRPKGGHSRKRVREQAERTAWKIQQDWLEVELTNIRLNQKEPLQSFLPYLWNGEKTYYEILKERGLRGLLPQQIVENERRGLTE